MKLFLDANVFFASAGSSQGGSACIINGAIIKKWTIVTVAHALHEAERNINLKLNRDALARHYKSLLESTPEIQPIDLLNLQQLSELGKFVPLKDVPILAGAILSKAGYLITLDRKDFIDNKNLKSLNLDFSILTPGDFLKNYVK